MRGFDSAWDARIDTFVQVSRIDVFLMLFFLLLLPILSFFHPSGAEKEPARGGIVGGFCRAGVG